MLIFLFPQTFFGLTDQYTENVYEQFFYLKQHGGWSFIEAYSLPIQLREWWVNRLGLEFKREQEAIDRAQNSRNNQGPVGH